jgi:hypothetical protein
MHKKSKQDEALSGAREPYAQPKLKELGQVGALTQAGTGVMAEMGVGMMDAMNQRP